MQSPAPRRVTMSEVARLAGVSPMTVSYTYNRPERVSGESRAKVLEAAAVLGYPGPDPSARSLRYGATRTLGVVMGEHLTYAFDDGQAVAFLAGVAEVCAERGYGLLIVPTGTGEEDPGRVVAAAVDAYVVWTTTADDPVLDAACSTQRPVVVHGGPDRPGTTLVTIDNRAAARAVALEVWTGAGRPVVLSLPVDRRRESFLRPGLDPDTVAYPVTRDRLAGFRDAAGNLGLHWSRLPVGVCHTNDEADAQAVMARLRESASDLDAVAAMSDRLALGALRSGGAPLRVSGWDDSALAREHDLTTVAQSMRAQGASCAAAALGDAPTVDHRDAWHVVRRGSTGGGAGTR
ncbi:LacI family DNA-binding transcriptional regulator [Nocardioides sp. cx-173]|uniref:LacI family DNA-binding transcriptional regulator n=1 Tax=Nocardioides sp. cx-173 TaxID=2898796 RepID=UPI001E5C1C29|nr:LacI family DNA-binding transcriptional regulator [Nocardioides sp. cx-173]MCD4524429.1 LacI family DNA-binding transcriptional regulator [Nocardioides sp. cx-173]UGB43085.1 LacI family DNA-binding transcriptional regulator [Nocardioides sp. cx-173]